MSNVLREDAQRKPPSFLVALLCAPLYNLAFRINKNNVSISGSEAWGDESTQHAPLRSHSRLPQLLSISRIFSNYIWNTITHTTHASMYSNSLVSNTLNPPQGLSAFCWWPFGVLRLGSWAACLPGETKCAFVSLSGSLRSIHITAHTEMLLFNWVATIK